MKKCPKCNKQYDDSWGICLDCKVQLVGELDNVNNRLSHLENQAREILDEIKEIRSGKITIEKLTESKPELKKEISTKTKPEILHKKEEDAEVQIGKYILSKIGIVSVVAGVAFLIAYTFKYLMPVHKILIGYAISAAMLYLGSRIERNEKFKWYGRGLIGGGWALIYFTTFAMHHIHATRIIQSQLVDLILLSAVVSAMIVHLFKYKSQSILAITLFLGYLTAGISTIGYFTFIYIALLALVAVILAYKMDWQRFAFFSLIGTYLTHLLWIMPQIYSTKTTIQLEATKFWLCTVFIAIYWIIYNLIPFLMKIKNEADEKTISGFIFINSLFFAFIGLLQVYTYNPDWRFNFAIIAALVTAFAGFISRYSPNKRQLDNIYYVLAIAFATASLPFKFGKTLVNFVWLAEIPILIYLGIRILEKSIYRIAGFILSLAVLLRLTYLMYSPKTLVVFAGQELSVRLFVFITAVICFYLVRYIYLYSQTFLEKNSNEDSLSNTYTVIATLLLLSIPVFEVQTNLVTIIWAITAFVLFIVGFVINDKVFRYSAMGVIACAVLRILAIDLAGVNTVHRILVFISLGVILLLASYWYTKASANISKKEKA